MNFLENRIPPPLVLIVTLLLMWGVSQFQGQWEWQSLPWLAAVLALTGVGIAVKGVMEFRRAQTTINPLNPNKASALVTTGVFSLSRNPMYLGMLLVTLGWAAALGKVLPLLFLLLFALFINRFQIVPEERAMRKLFGSDFALYSSKTSRWL